MGSSAPGTTLAAPTVDECIPQLSAMETVLEAQNNATLPSLKSCSGGQPIRAEPPLSDPRSEDALLTTEPQKTETVEVKQERAAGARVFDIDPETPQGHNATKPPMKRHRENMVTSSLGVVDHLGIARLLETRLKRSIAVLAGLAVFFTLPPCNAQTGLVDTDHMQGKAPIAPEAITTLGPDLFGDKVNLYNGTVHFEQTDISLPGNSALPVALIRHREPGRSWFVRGVLADWDLHVPRIEATFGEFAKWRNFPLGARCSRFGNLESQVALARSWWGENNSINYLVDFWPWEYGAGINLVVPGYGQQEILEKRPDDARSPRDGGTYPNITRNNWQIGCLPTAQNDPHEAFVAVSPEGVRYRFDWFASRAQRPVGKYGATLRRADFYLMATLVTDRFGNWVQYHYDPANPLQLQRIESNDGRQIVLGYQGPNIVSATDGTRTWQYVYGANLGEIRGDLESVIQPDGSRWAFDLRQMADMGDQVDDWYKDCDSLPFAPGGPFIGRMTHPSGAQATFTTMFLQHGRTNVDRLCTYNPFTGSLWWTDGSLYARSTVSQSLVSKEITGPGSAPMTWNYADWGSPWGAWTCSDCPDRKTVQVTDPTGAVTRHTFGIRWRDNEGQLLQLDEGWNGTTALRTTTYRYRDTGAQSYPDKLAESRYFHSDYLSTRNRPLDQRQITQQGETFNWQSATGMAGFDEFARPKTYSAFSTLGFGRTESKEYYDNDALWVLGQVARVSNIDTGIEISRSSFDTNTALASAEYSFGRLTHRSNYHPNGAVRQQIDPIGRATTFDDYMRGIPRLITARDGTVQTAQVSNIGKVTSYTDASGATTTYGYDSMGRLASINYPQEPWGTYYPTTIAFEQVNEVEYGIPALHWRQTVTTGNARTVRYFDAMWRVGFTQTWDMSDPPGTNRVIVNRYDGNGRRIFESQPQRSLASGTTPGRSWFYDALGRVIVQREDSELGPLDSFSQYIDGFRRKSVNPRGYATIFSFQAFDEPIETSPRKIEAPENVTVTIKRDLFDKPTSIARSGDGKSAERRYAYDVHQRLCKTTELESGSTVVAYDQAGNLFWRAVGLNLPGEECDHASAPVARAIYYAYDARDRLTSTTFGDGSPAITRSYTADGLLQQIVGGDAVHPVTWTYAYNNRRLLTQERYTWAGPQFGWAFDWTIDPYGHASALSDLWGTMYYVPNALGEPTQVSGFATNVRFHPNGSVASYKLANDVFVNNELNIRGLPQQTRSAGITNDFYQYDANGNVAQILDDQEGLNTRGMPYYDGLDRLRAASGPWGTAQFSYDALDNLVASTVGSRVLQHQIDQATNRLVGLTGSQSLSIASDVNGNVTQRGSQSFNFDIGNRMTSAPGKFNKILYDGHGRRNMVWRADGGLLHQGYTKDGKLRLAWDSAEGYTRHVYLHDKLLAEQSDGGVKAFLHVDALGSPVAKSNINGGLIYRTRYEPYGATVEGSTAPSKIGYTGHVNDADTGLVYMQQRYYDPVAGRFLSVDPVVTDAKTGDSFNRYVYGNNNPFKFKDPDGRHPIGASDNPVRQLWDAAFGPSKAGSTEMGTVSKTTVSVGLVEVQRTSSATGGSTYAGVRSTPALAIQTTVEGQSKVGDASGITLKVSASAGAGSVGVTGTASLTVGNGISAQASGGAIGLANDKGSFSQKGTVLGVRPPAAGAGITVTDKDIKSVISR